MRGAVVNEAGEVVNVIEIRPGSNWHPPEGHILVVTDEADPAIGDTWGGEHFVKGTPPRDPAAEYEDLIAEELRAFAMERLEAKGVTEPTR